jgi:structural maintenance of chromosome 1
MELNSHQIKSQNKALNGLREEQRVHDKALDGARAEQAKVRATVMQMEKKIKKAEKALDGKVSSDLFLGHGFGANAAF